MKNTDGNNISQNEMISNKIKEYIGKRSLCSVQGRQSVELCGCCGLITYRDDVMEIRLCDCHIRILGTGLTINHYYGGRMIIRGYINSVEYYENC